MAPAVDETAPTFSLTTPATTTDVAITTRSVVLTASEVVTKVGTDVTGTLKVGDAAATAINYVFDAEAKTLTYSFAEDLAYSTTYAFTVDADQVQDEAENKNAETSAFSFTTEANIPAAITSVTPNGGAVNGNSTVTVVAEGTVYYQWSASATATIGVGEWTEGSTITVPNTAGRQYLHVYAYKAADNKSAITTKEFTMTKVDQAVTKVWDFTQALSATDVANIAADATWTEEGSEGSNVWVTTQTTGKDYITLTANGSPLEFTEGLSFGRSGSNMTSNGSIKINQSSNYLHFNSSNMLLKISGLKAGDVIEMKYKSTNSTARGFAPKSNVTYNGEDTGYNSTGTEVTPTYTVIADGAVEFTAQQTYIYYIKVMQTVPVVEASVTTYGWATFNSDQPLDLTNVDFAYQVTGVDGTTVALVPVTGKVAANTPLILKGTEGSATELTIPVADEGSDISSTNKLVAVTADATSVAKADGKTRYVLAVQEEKAVFASINATAATLNKGQAYLELDGEVAPARLSFGFDDDETTGIVSAAQQPSTGHYYDLQGRRVAQPQKGLYIVNGKKVVIK